MTKKPPLLTKRQRALQELEHASQAVGHALSLLGGRTRHKPRAWPNTTFTCRQYLEGIASRLDVVSRLVTGIGYVPGPEADLLKPGLLRSIMNESTSDSLGAISAAFPRDEFEAVYDKAREPGC